MVRSSPQTIFRERNGADWFTQSQQSVFCDHVLAIYSQQLCIVIFITLFVCFLHIGLKNGFSLRHMSWPSLELQMLASKVSAVPDSIEHNIGVLSIKIASANRRCLGGKSKGNRSYDGQSPVFGSSHRAISPNQQAGTEHEQGRSPGQGITMFTMQYSIGKC